MGLRLLTTLLQLLKSRKFELKNDLCELTEINKEKSLTYFNVLFPERLRKITSISVTITRIWAKVEPRSSCVRTESCSRQSVAVRSVGSATNDTSGYH